MVKVSLLVWLSQLHAVPWSATAVAAAVPDFGEKVLSSPKLGLKSYTAWAETRVPHGIFVGVPAGAAEGLGEVLGDAVALVDDEALADGEALGVDEPLGRGLAGVPGPGTHPASPSATVAASATTIDRSRESAILFIVRHAPWCACLHLHPVKLHRPAGRASGTPGGSR
jgi:hypothetical protein